MKNKIGIAIFIVLIFIAGVFILGSRKSNTQNNPSPTPETKKAIERSFGKEDSKVIVTEFSDFECPACGNFAVTAKKLREQYKDKIKFVFKHYPLGQHKYAFGAAEASECAGDQGKFWEYEEILFSNQNNLTLDDLKKYAAELSLDIEKFNSCLENDTFVEKIEADKKEGEDRGVNSTPTTFVNNLKVRGSVSFENIQKIIDEELLR